MSRAASSYDTAQTVSRAKSNAAPLRVNKPGDTYEQEADRVADRVSRGERMPQWSLSTLSAGRIQRDPAPQSDPQPDPNAKPLTTDDMIKKAAEALLATKAGQAAVTAIKKDPVVKSTTDFLSTPAGIVISGVAATGVIAGLAAAHKPLPMQIPKLPLDFIHPGLSIKIDYQGPVNHPTGGMITLSFGPSDKKKKDEKADYRAETARMRAEMDMFRDKSQDYPAQGPLANPQQAGPAAQPTPDVITGADPAAKPEDKKPEEAPVQRKADSTLDHSAVHTGSVDDALRGSGHSLDANTRHFMESRIGFDFSKVRVFTDTRAADSARDLKARAYTVGSSIVFDSGNYKPQSPEGKKLLAHELTHVVQQDRNLPAKSADSARVDNSDVAAPLSRVNRGASGPIIQRQCSCGGSGSSGGECEECKKDAVQRKASGTSEPATATTAATAPAIVHEVLRSPGQPLDAQTRAFMEPRFGHDFSKVRIHTDARAAESAQAVSAHAYTAGRDVVFGRGQYSPSTQAGRILLAHELTHVVQQGFRDASSDQAAEIGPVGDRHEQAADRVAASLYENSARSMSPEGSSIPAGSPAAIQRQAMNCPTQKDVNDECDKATANCQSAAGDCKSDFPDPGDLDAYISKVKGTFASSDFGPNAKRNFGHWLDGSGSDLEMPSAVFEAHDATKHALLVARDHIVDGVQKRLADGRMKLGVVSDVIAYSGHANAFSFGAPHSDDLAYAVGGYQLCSNVRAKATAAGDGTTNVDFAEWKSQAFDCYNWDPGKGIGIGMLSDTKLCCVENAGKAKHFLDHSTIWDNKDPDSTKSFSVAGTGSGTAKTPPKKEDSR
jgi:hypothetical protein